ncbi:WXG100 family type VII secretion target [Streptomyces xiamenensis]|uniref:WXG100 family type VII secretion target n=1 Tax=Streptomyces xiamenensis TaxID=408015 RepID=UPI0036E9E0AF
MSNDGTMMRYGGVLEKAAEITRNAEGMKEHVEYLVGEVRRVSEVWEGSTKEAFLFQQQRLRAAIEALAEIQNNTSTRAGDATTAFQYIDALGGRGFGGP